MALWKHFLISILMDKFDWKRLKDSYKAWWAGELERPLIAVKYPSSQATELQHDHWGLARQGGAG